MRITEAPEFKQDEGHVFYATLGVLCLQDGTALEAEVAFLWDRQSPLTVEMDIEAFPGSQIRTIPVPCAECQETIPPGELAVTDLDRLVCTTCTPVDPDMSALWTLSLDQIAAAIEDRADRAADVGDVQMTRHLGSRLKMRLFNGEAYCFLDFSVHRLEQLVNAINYARACSGGASELESAYLNDGIRALEEFLAE